tara:strand:- start:317 stop:622 length:306 start_codon:yes stop_codon:yes gene_type:complete
MKINIDECEIEIVENKDGSRTILLDGQFYVPLEKKDVTLDRLKPTRKRLDMVGRSLVQSREALERTFKEMKDMRTRQNKIEHNMVKIAEALAKMDLGYNNQ